MSSEDVIYRILIPIVVGALIAECASKKHWVAVIMVFIIFILDMVGIGMMGGLF